MAQILVAEDDLHILRIVSIWLKKHGHIVHEASNGQVALEKMSTLRPDILIADVNMPVMDGIELVRTCESKGFLTKGTIILTSRCDQGEIRDRLANLDILLHPKPFSPSKLVRDVEQLLASDDENGKSAELVRKGAADEK